MKETTYTLEETIETLLREKKFASLRDIFSTMNPADLALLLEAMDEEKLPLLFRLIPKEQAAEAFVEMESETQEMLIRGFSDNELKEVIDELYVDDAVDIVEEMPANVVKRILRQADPETRKMINELLKYPEDSAGSIMTTEYVSLLPSMTAEDAIKRIRRTGIDKETIYTCYVTSETKELIGFLSLKTLLLSAEDSIVAEIMDQNVISVKTTDDREEVARLISRYGFVALPVADTENRLVGIVTVDDAMDVIQEEATEDIELMAAITPSDKPYLKTGILESWKSRIPWLLLLMISATLTGIVIANYEVQLAACSILTAYIPMLMGTGGNSGSQSSASIIRSISLGELHFSSLPKVIWKESRVALLCGVTLAAFNFLKLLFFDRYVLGYDTITPLIALVVCLTLISTVLCAKLVGGSLPVIAKKLGFDPAVMASPLLSTTVDVLSLVIYFRWATWLLRI